MLNIGNLSNYNTLIKNTIGANQGTADNLDVLFNNALTSRYVRAINSDLTSQVNNFLDSVNTTTTNLEHSLAEITVSPAPIRALDTASEALSNAKVTDTATIDEVEVNVESIATAQTNTGDEVDADEETEANEGTETIQITRGDETLNIDVAISAGDTNQIVLTNITNAINNADAPITATLESNDNNTIQLVLDANETGEDNGFTVEGNLVDLYNLNNPTTEAQDAQIEVNGEVQTSSDNTIELDDGNLTFDIIEPTDEPIIINVEANTEDLTNQLNQVVTAFNDLRESLLSEPTNRRATIAARQLENTIDRDANAFEAIGITRNTTGELQLDTNQLNEAIRNQAEQVNDTITDDNGIFSKLSNRTDAISEIPDTELAETDIQANTPLTYTTSSAYFSPIQATRLNNMQNTGILIDMMFQRRR